MYVIVVGAGATGYHIASVLAKTGQEVVMIEQSEELVDYVCHQLDVGVVLGNGVNPNILRQVEVHRADLLVATTANDEANMVICSMAHELGAQKTVARVRNSEYYSGYLTVGKSDSPYAPRKVERPIRMGINHFVNPEEETAKQIEDSLSGLYASHAQELANGRVQVREFKVESDANVLNKPLHFVKEMSTKPFAIALLVKSKEIMVPSGEEVISKDDHVYIIAIKEDMEKLGALFNHLKSPTKRVTILGGGIIGYHVAEVLDKRGVQIKLIEKDKARSEEINAKLRRVEVLHSLGTDRNFLIEEGIPSSDAFIATTGDEALNILVGLLAKSLGASRNIVVVDKPEYVPLAESVGIDVALSPLIIAGNKVTSIALHGNVVSMAMLENEQAQATEFVVNKMTRIAGKSKGSIKLPKGAVIAAIIHGSNILISPADDEIIKEHDHVIVVSLCSIFPQVEKLFKKNNAN